MSHSFIVNLLYFFDCPETLVTLLSRTPLGQNPHFVSFANGALR
jgi:hypothetical protein